MKSDTFPPIARPPIEAVIIGASAGGVDALWRLFSTLPAIWHLPMVAVLHLPEEHQSGLPQLFAQRLSLVVREAEDKMPIDAGHLYFAPPGYHLSIERDRRFSLSCEPPVMFSRPSIDLAMNSAADVYGQRLAGLILTGANRDGAAGLQCIHRAGGVTIVQTPAEALMSAMPAAAIAMHPPDHVLALRQIRQLLCELDAAHAFAH